MYLDNKNFGHRHFPIVFKGVTLFLLASLLLFGFPVDVKAFNTQEELNRLMTEQENLEAQWEDAKSTLSLFENEQALASSNLAWIRERSAEQQALYEGHMLQVAAITDLQQSLDRNLEVAIRQFEHKKENYADRIESMYNLQKKSQLEILLESDSLSSYYSTLRFMKLISDADEQDLEYLRQARDELQVQYEETTAQLEQLATLLNSIEADMMAIQNDLAEHESNVAALDAELYALYNTVQQYSDDHFQLQLDIEEANRRKEQEEYLASLQTQNPSYGQPSYNLSYSGNGFVWPLAYYDFITSEYGSRYLPELGYPEFHTGIDFAADWNTPCLASAPGVVVFAGWYNDYGGNTVRIDIGSGIVIMYCHLNTINVVAGQSVGAGEVVGTVGSSGLSTGPHLHFQVDVGGSHVDPRLYLY